MSFDSMLLPTDERKPDTSENSSGMEKKLLHAKKRDREMGKVALRIDERTVVMVTPDKRTSEYAAFLREKYKKSGL